MKHDLEYYKYTKRIVRVMNNSITLPHFDWLIDNFSYSLCTSLNFSQYWNKFSRKIRYIKINIIL